MSKYLSHNSLRPWLSLSAILMSVFLMVFLQMESRRMGYIVWKQVRVLKSAKDSERSMVLKFAKINRPERLRELAESRMTLNEIKNTQVVHMSGDRVAVR